MWTRAGFVFGNGAPSTLNGSISPAAQPIAVQQLNDAHRDRM